MLRNLHANLQITSMGDLLNSLSERSERRKATKLWNDTLIQCIMTAFVRGATELDFPSQLAARLSQLPRICFFFIHYTESLLSNVWKRLIILTVFFVSSLSSATPFSRNMRFGHEPGRATCLVVKCSYNKLGTQLRRLWRGQFQPQHNVRECAPDSHRSKAGVSEEHFR